MGPGEHPNWGVVAEQLVDVAAPMHPHRLARLTLADGRVLNAPVSVHVMSDGLTRELSVPLPAGTAAGIGGAGIGDGEKRAKAIEVLSAEVNVDGESFPVSVPELFGP